jgi:hypothetical protein
VLFRLPLLPAGCHDVPLDNPTSLDRCQAVCSVEASRLRPHPVIPYRYAALLARRHLYKLAEPDHWLDRLTADAIEVVLARADDARRLQDLILVLRVDLTEAQRLLVEAGREA